MEKAYDCVLTLVFPQHLEEPILDHLAQHAEWIGHGSIARTECFGHEGMLRRPLEKVMGRSLQYSLNILMQQIHIPLLIDSLNQHIKSSEVIYWATPLLTSGKLL